MNETETIDTVAAAYVIAKECEVQAKELREEAERRLLNLIDVKPGDTKTATALNYSVTVKAGLNQRVDQAMAVEIIGELPDEQDALVVRYDLSLTGLKAMERYYPEAVAILRRAITTKPAKPTIKVTEV